MSNELVHGRYNRLPKDLERLVEPLRAAGASHYAVLRGSRNDRSQAGWLLGHTGNLHTVMRMLPVLHRAPGPDEVSFPKDNPIWTRKVGLSWLNDFGETIGVSQNATIKIYGKYAKGKEHLTLRGEPRLTSLSLKGKDLYKDDRGELWNILNPKCPSPECSKRGRWKEDKSSPGSPLHCSSCGFQVPEAPLAGRWLLFGFAGDDIFARAFSANAPESELLSRWFPKKTGSTDGDKLEAITNFKSGVFGAQPSDARPLSGGLAQPAVTASPEELKPAVSDLAPAEANTDERQVLSVADTITGIGRPDGRSNEDLARLLTEKYEEVAFGSSAILEQIDFVVLDTALGSDFERRVIAKPKVGFFSENVTLKKDLNAQEGPQGKDDNKRKRFLKALAPKWPNGRERSLPQDERELHFEQGGVFLFTLATPQGPDPIVGWKKTKRDKFRDEGNLDLAWEFETVLADRLTFVLVRHQNNRFVEATIYTAPNWKDFSTFLKTEEISYEVVFPDLENHRDPLEVSEFRLPSKTLYGPDRGSAPKQGVFEKKLEVPLP